MAPATAQTVTPTPIQPVQPPTATPAPPPPSLAPNAPSGPVTAAAVCCPDVATFEGSTGARNTYFGFDDKTNVVQNVGADEYWIPPTDAKSLPGNKETRDGARWVSVAVGREAQVEINFGGTFTNICLANCTYEIAPTSVAEVSSPKPTATGAVFKIKGKSPGEASVKVTCDGQVRGYFHIWCKQRATINLDVGAITTSRATAPGYSVAALTTVLNEIYSQTLIRFVVNDVGTVDLSGLPATHAFNVAEAATYSGGVFTSTAPFLTALDAAVQAKLTTAAAGNNTTYTAAPYQLFYYVPTSPARSAWGGSVINVGSSPGYCFFHDGATAASHNSMAHEQGHAMGLRHPSDGGSAGQLGHLRGTRGQAVTAMAATNTEPAVPAALAKGNVMAADPLNLLGYWSNKPARKPLRYNQWKSCARS
ncbi:MAG: hypothetical protein AAFY39_02135 [Pseudomonadota bacterium]